MNDTPDKPRTFKSLIDNVREIVAGLSNTNEKLLSICTLLSDTIPYYNWVCFYLVYQSRELMLGPFVGEHTEHIQIPFGQGIRGQAAERKETVIAQDVTKETNYLSCSPEVKSEMVVPIFKHPEFVGVLDIDSHTGAPFTAED